MKNNGHISKAEWIRKALERYEGPLIQHAAQIMGNVDRARDVVQDTFLKLCDQEPEKLDGYLTEWLFRVCRNRALDVQRKENRMQPLTDVELDHRPCPDPQPDQAAERHEATAELTALVERLSTRERELVRLKFQQGLSYAEISRITHLSVSNVGFILHRAIQTLRRQIKSSPGLSPRHFV